MEVSDLTPEQARELRLKALPPLLGANAEGSHPLAALNAKIKPPAEAPPAPTIPVSPTVPETPTPNPEPGENRLAGTPEELQRKFDQLGITIKPEDVVQVPRASDIAPASAEPQEPRVLGRTPEEYARYIEDVQQEAREQNQSGTPDETAALGQLATTLPENTPPQLEIKERLRRLFTGSVAPSPRRVFDTVAPGPRTVLDERRTKKYKDDLAISYVGSSGQAESPTLEPKTAEQIAAEQAVNARIKASMDAVRADATNIAKSAQEAETAGTRSKKPSATAKPDVAK